VLIIMTKIALRMKVPEYNLSDNTWDLTNTLARSASDRK